MTTVITDVPGFKVKTNSTEMNLCKLDVRITNDKLGKSLSICNLDDGIMYQIPITDKMPKELTKK